MIDYILENMWQLWVAIAFVCLILELTSGDLFIICFAVGAASAAIDAGLFGNSIYVQLFTFAVCSLISIFYIRPAARRWLHKGEENRVSNADALIGREGRVTEAITPDQPGYVQIDGDQWRAVSNEAIDAGSKVQVVSRESTIVTVEKI